MESLILAIGAKTCCIGAAGAGGMTNWIVNRKIAWTDLIAAVFVGWISAEFFIPPIMKHFTLDIVWGPAMAFVIGYCGIRLLPVIEARAKGFIQKS